MIRRYFRTLFAGCLLLAPAFAFAKSRTMSPQQYEAFINKLDAAVSGWQDQIKHLDAISLPIDGEKRKPLTAKGALAGAVLDQIKSTVSAERDHPSLALEITMLDRLSSASGVLTELITDVPDSAARKPWADAVRAIEDDISAYDCHCMSMCLAKPTIPNIKSKTARLRPRIGNNKSNPDTDCWAPIHGRCIQSPLESKSQ